MVEVIMDGHIMSHYMKSSSWMVVFFCIVSKKRHIEGKIMLASSLYMEDTGPLSGNARFKL